MSLPHLRHRVVAHAAREDGRTSAFALMILIMLAFMWPDLKQRYPEARKIDRGARHVVRDFKREYAGVDHKVSVRKLLDRDR
jgi:hypothetical protein